MANGDKPGARNTDMEAETRLTLAKALLALSEGRAPSAGGPAAAESGEVNVFMHSGELKYTDALGLYICDDGQEYTLGKLASRGKTIRLTIKLEREEVTTRTLDEQVLIDKLASFLTERAGSFILLDATCAEQLTPSAEPGPAPDTQTPQTPPLKAEQAPARKKRRRSN